MQVQVFQSPTFLAMQHYNYPIYLLLVSSRLIRHIGHPTRSVLRTGDIPGLGRIGCSSRSLLATRQSSHDGRTYHLVHGSKPKVPFDPSYRFHETPRDVHEYLDIGICSLYSARSESSRDITEVLDSVFGNPYR